jgi:hypothetical protein
MKVAKKASWDLANKWKHLVWTFKGKADKLPGPSTAFRFLCPEYDVLQVYFCSRIEKGWEEWGWGGGLAAAES